MANRDKKLKVYGRLDGSNVLIPGSVRWGRTMPKNGHWVELTPVDYCCGSTTTTTTTAVPFNCVTYGVTVERGGSVSFTYDNCDGSPAGPFELSGPVSDVFCAAPDTVEVVTGEAVFTILGECEPPTTTTTTTEAPTTSTTTTTTTEEPSTTTTTTTTTGG